MGRKLSANDLSYLKTLYYNTKSKSCYTSAESLYRNCKIKHIKLKDIKKWLLEQETFTLHKQIRKNFLRRRVLVSHIDDIWQIDLVDMQKLKKYNKGYSYLLTCIDVFSKYAWAIPIKNKEKKTVTNAFKSILTRSKRKPKKIHSDKGVEFLNKLFQQLLFKNMIGFYTTENDTKACVVERFHRSLKSRMWKYFTFKNTRIYIDVLPDLMIAYNKSFHRSIQMSPYNVNKKNSSKVLSNLYKGDKPKQNYKLKINDKVRISKYKNIFAKGYKANWSKELFVITEINRKQSPTVYHITDLNGELIKGSFYAEELQKVIKNDNIWQIEKIIKRRTKNNKKQYFVKWKGYPSNFNSWISSTDIV
jgi:Integrase core domain/Chromo (CHRromatin Organisation MOdifier) domain